ncbi:MAG: DUF370 domain-containing protein [Lachnospiraceae bacterium]|nr:DUF370 domain-containing protein [Eubacterium sp.]MCI6795537.1 DUF370 domain-containing protein [Lachnospiraceae bacterium]MDD6684616.1 DUF370 domain-containing protein [Lachnospiraceae bacterium]MDD7047741.1 DUF370 domain-containing protein [Lachnospiraceae bacterium]
MVMLLNIGFGNSVNTDKIFAVVSPVAAPVKRLVTQARQSGTVIDATQGRKTKAVLVLCDGWIVLSALQPETLTHRFNQPCAAIDAAEETE